MHEVGFQKVKGGGGSRPRTRLKAAKDRSRTGEQGRGKPSLSALGLAAPRPLESPVVLPPTLPSPQRPSLAFGPRMLHVL